MDSAGGPRPRSRRGTILMSGYGTASLALTGLYPFLRDPWARVDVLVISTGAAAGVAYGRRAVRRGGRRPWTLLLAAFVAFVAASLARLMSQDAAGWLLDATGNLLTLGAALAVVLRCGGNDLGGAIDAAVMAFGIGSILLVVLPHRLGSDQSFPAQLNLFVVVFALTGVLGALLRLAQTVAQPTALVWLLPATGLSIAGNAVLSVTASVPALQHLPTMLFLAATTATGLFGLDPTGPRLAYTQEMPPERLSAGRLVFLCAAVAVIPIIIGTRKQLAGDTGGALLAAQGILIAVLVMARIGLLSAQRGRAEQALVDEASRDPLTRLLNRRAFLARLRREVDRTAQCAVLLCDIDDFKLVNDRFGHDAGDALLIEVARRLRACAGPQHAVSRFGGDEFVILLVDTSPSQAHATRECIIEGLQQPFPSAGGAGLRISIGLAHTTDERDPEQLIRSADRAMYREKVAHRRDPSPTAQPSEWSAA